MQFNQTVLDYFRFRYPHHDQWLIEELSHNIQPLFEEHGVTAVRKALKEAGIPRVPQFVQDYKDNYIPRICAAEVYIDGEAKWAYAGHQSRLHTRDYNLVLVGFLEYYTRDSLNSYPASSSGITYTIIDWIEFGAECEECGDIFIDDAPSYRRNTICPSCREGSEPYQYSARAEDILGEIPSKEVRFGIELEYEDVTAKQVKKSLFKHAIAKRDGSIDSGVEVVTIPAPMKLHKEKLKQFFQEVHTQANSNTGMHVHIERSKISEYQVGFIMEFLNRESLYPQLMAIAGRDFKENTYCRQKPEMKMTWGLYYDTKLERGETDKYCALNTAKNKTIEVRIFSSPESHLECSAKLEFIEGLVAFSSPYAVHVDSLKEKFEWKTFEAYMTTNKKHYPSFYAYYQGVI